MAAPAATRGYVLISVDTLRADRLGCYGYDRDTSPFLDALAARGVVFERAFAQAPSTLVSHLSMFTGLYPGQHGVDGTGSNVLSPAIPTLPEVFARAGFRTAGHTEGGYMLGEHGFARGFEVFSDPPWSAEQDVEATFAKGLDFVRALGDDERFFLFLHTYTVHDPYTPPPPWGEGIEAGEDLGFEPTGRALVQVNDGERELTPGQVRRLGALYDAGIRYFDQVLEGFVGELETLGLLDDVTLVVTSDHGEELREHGRLLHTQVYREGLHVPLIVVHPRLEPRRVAAPVRLVDLAPTLWHLAGLAAPEIVAGRSLVPYLVGAEMDEASAYGEVRFLKHQRTLVARVDGTLYQLVVQRPFRETDGGTWVAESIDFEAPPGRLEFRALAFHRPRRVEVRAGGGLVARLDLETQWRGVSVEVPSGAAPGPVPVSLRSLDGCESPVSVGRGEDPRCLGFKVLDLPLATVELYDLDRDFAGRHDLAGERPEIVRRLLRRLDEHRFEPLAPAGSHVPSPEERKALEALGYL